MRDLKQGERGIVLVIALGVMLIFSVLGVTYLTLSATETKIASNHANATRAFDLAEAGVGLGKQKLDNTTDWNSVLVATQPFNCPALGQTGNDGCSYLIEDDDDGDSDTTIDSNRTVVIKSTGTFRDSSRKIHIAYTNPMYLGGNSAFNFTGVDSRIDYSGSGKWIDGNNWIPPSDDLSVPAVLDNNACGPGSGPQWGLSTPDEAQKVALKDAIKPQDAAKIIGLAPDAPWSPVSPTPSIGANPSMTQSDLETIGNTLLASADVTYAPGAIISNTVMSTQAAPLVHAVDCTGYIGLCLELKGTSSGAGILVVKNGQMLLRATARWIGIIVVYGTNIKFDTNGGGTGNIIYGSIFIGEDTSAVDKQVRLRNTRVRYSCQAIAMANLAANFTITDPVVWWKEVY